MAGKGRSRGIAISYIYTILNTVIGLFISAYIIRMMGQTEYGVYQTMTSFATYLTLFQFGTGSIMTRNISLCRKDGSETQLYKKNTSTIWTVAVVQAVIIASISIVFYLMIDVIYQKSLTTGQIQYGKLLFLIVALKMILTFFIQVLNGIILGCEHYSMSTIVQLVFLLVRTGLVVALLLFKPFAIYLVILDAVLEIIMFIFTYCYCRKNLAASFSFKYFNKKIFMNALPLAMALFLQTIINMANGNVDKFVIGILMSPEAVSVYSIGMFIYTTFSSLTTIPISMYMPKVAADMREGKQGAELTKSLIQPCRLIFLIGGLVLFGFIVIGRQFISIVYGSDYIEAWAIAVVIMIPMLINMSNGVLVNVLDIMNKRLSRSFFLLITTIGNIILTIWWIQTWGMLGAAVATGICTLIGQDLLLNIYYNKVIKIRILYLFKETFRGILPSLVLATVLGFLSINWITNQYLQFVVGGMVFGLVMGVSMIAFGANSYEKQKILVLRNKYISRSHH